LIGRFARACRTCVSHVEEIFYGCPARRWDSVRRTARNAGRRLVLHHHPSGLEIGETLEVLVSYAARAAFRRWRRDRPLAVLREGDAVHGQMSTQGRHSMQKRRGKHVWTSTVQAGDALAERRAGVIASSNLGGGIVLQRDDLSRGMAPCSACRLKSLSVAPIRAAQLSATRHLTREAGFSDVPAEIIMWIDQRGIVAVRHRPLIVLRGRPRRHPRKTPSDGSEAKRLGIDLGNVPMVEFDAAIAFESTGTRSLARPRPHVVEGVVWSGSQRGDPVRLPLALYSALTFWKVTPVASALGVGEGKRPNPNEVRGIGCPHCMGLLSPRARLHLLETGATRFTLTSAPRGAARVRQQSIAVLPPPRRSRACRSGGVAERASWKASPMQGGIWAAVPCGPGMSSSRPRGAPAASEDRFILSASSVSSGLLDAIGRP